MALVALPPRTVPKTVPQTIPARDLESRAHLDAVARRGAPLVLARERVLPVPGALGPLVPGGALQRGTVVSVTGASGAGVTSAALGLAAAATAAGEWAAAIDLDGTIGGLAAAEAGVDLDRFAVVRRVANGQWATVVAALLDGVSLVLAEVPRGVRGADARRLIARARERSTTLVVVGADARRWPADVGLRLQVTGGAWLGLADGGGVLATRALAVHVEGRGVRPGTRLGAGAREEPALELAG